MKESPFSDAKTEGIKNGEPLESIKTPEEETLFTAGMEITPDGLYTLVYHYHHPETGKEIVLLGMNHWGSGAYFNEAGEYLKDRDVIIHEGVRPENRERYQEIWKRLDEILEQEISPMDKEFHEVSEKYMRTAFQKLQLKTEREVSREDQKNWIAGDETFLLSLTEEESLKNYARQQLAAFRRIPDATKQALIKIFADGIRNMDKGEWPARDLANCYRIISPIEELYAIPSQERKREELVMQTLEKVFREKNTRRVAIKFGATHAKGLKNLLQAKGYIIKKVDRIKNLDFAAGHNVES